MPRPWLRWTPALCAIAAFAGEASCRPHPDRMPSAASLPAEVSRWVERRAACDHWRGEEPYDAQRASAIVAGVRANCAGSDAALARLRARYRDDKVIAALLAPYDRAE